MNDLSQILKAGDLLIVETGEYSDSSWHGPVRMLITASKAELAEAYRAEWAKENSRRRDRPDESGFLPWLVCTKRAEHVDATSWHVGSYGRFEP